MKGSITTRDSSHTKALELEYSYRIMSFMGELVAGADHEINNLLMMIDGSSKIINDKSTTAKQKEMALNEIEIKTHRIKDIMTELRSVMKDGSTEMIKTFYIKELLSKGVALCKTRFKNHRIFISTNISEDLQIEGRETQLVQALLAVLTSSHDSIINHQERWIKVFVSEEEAQLSITVTDSGNPLTNTDLANIYDFNYVSADGRKGIGLIMARAIMEIHKGTMYVYNDDANIPSIKLILPKNQPYAIAKPLKVNNEVIEEIEIFNNEVTNRTKQYKVS